MTEADLIAMIDEAIENERIWRGVHEKLCKLECNRHHIEEALKLYQSYRDLVDLLRRWEHCAMRDVEERLGGAE